MVDIVQQILLYFQIHKKNPQISELDVSEHTWLLWQKWTVFVTLYKSGNIVWSSGNIVELKENIVQELIENTFQALHDNRFPNILPDISQLKIRVDHVINKHILTEKHIKDLNPIKNGVIVIKKDHTKLACILPNISPSISTGQDFFPVLSKKLWEDFKEDNYIISTFNAETFTNY